MKLSDLHEGMSTIVYHATSFKNATTILSTNSLRSHAGHISFTRTLGGAYHRNNKMIGVIFEVDGNKLNQRFKGGPVGTEDWDWGNFTPFPDVYRGKENQQYEDRVAVDTIPKFSSYITKMYMCLPEEYLNNVSKYTKDELDTVYVDDIKFVENCMVQADKLNIPTVYIGSIRDLNSGRENVEKFLNNYHKIHDTIKPD